MLAKSILGVVLAVFCVSIQAAPLSFQTKTIEAKSCFVSKDKEKRCHGKTVAYPITDDQHFDAWVKKVFDGKLPTKKSVKQELQNNEMVQDVNQRNLEEDSDFPCTVAFIDTLELEGFSPNYAVFGEEEWEYTCGAHGRGMHILTVLPRHTANPQALELQDIVLPNQMDKLIHLQKEAFIQYLQEPEFEMNEKEARKYFHEYNEKFNGTSNWRMGKNSIIFLFQHYEIAAYSFGRPELVIPVKDLQGIIKPEILRETEHYTPRPEKP